MADAYKLFKRDHCGEKTSSALYYFHVETVAHHINQIKLGMALVNSGYQWRIKIEYYIF